MLWRLPCFGVATNSKLVIVVCALECNKQGTGHKRPCCCQPAACKSAVRVFAASTQKCCALMYPPTLTCTLLLLCVQAARGQAVSAMCTLLAMCNRNHAEKVEQSALLSASRVSPTL